MNLKTRHELIIRILARLGYCLEQVDGCWWIVPLTRISINYRSEFHHEFDAN